MSVLPYPAVHINFFFLSLMYYYFLRKLKEPSFAKLGWNFNYRHFLLLNSIKVIKFWLSIAKHIYNFFYYLIASSSIVIKNNLTLYVVSFFYFFNELSYSVWMCWPITFPWYGNKFCRWWFWWIAWSRWPTYANHITVTVLHFYSFTY